MPTGYTAGVEDGTIKTFKDFALLCARAFGACVEMCDEPLTKPIPKEFPVSTYAKTQLAEAKEELDRLLNMGAKQIEKEFASYKTKEMQHLEEGKRKAVQARQRIQKMRAEASAWVPPTKDHKGLKDFMLEQLSSDSWDHVQYYTEEIAKLETMSVEEWQAKRTKDARWNIDYYKKTYREDLERTNGRNQWLDDLRASLNKG